MNDLDEKIKSRKLIITVLVMFAAFVMARNESLPSDLASILISAISSYGAGNVLAGENDRGANKYRSSKFVLTIVVIIGSCIAASTGFLTGPLANVLTACIATFNVAKGYAKK